MTGRAKRGGAPSVIRVHDDPSARQAERVTESAFQADPGRYLQMVREGGQVIVTDDGDSDRIVMVIGTNGVRIEVHDPNAEQLPDDVEAQCDEIDYDAWLR